jgi:Spy/CpxP family protein refolding chaperone
MQTLAFLAVVVSASITLTGTVAAANNDKENHYSGKHQQKVLERMTKALNLSEQQVADIKAIHDQARQPSRAVDRKNSIMLLDPSSPDYTKKVAALAAERAAQTEQAIIKRGELRLKVHALLTPEQQQKAKQLAEKRQQRISSNRPEDKAE